MNDQKNVFVYHYVAKWYNGTMEFTLDGVASIDFKVVDYPSYRKFKDTIVYPCILREMNATEEDIPNSFSLLSLSVLDVKTVVDMLEI